MKGFYRLKSKKFHSSSAIVLGRNNVYEIVTEDLGIRENSRGLHRHRLLTILLALRRLLLHYGVRGVETPLRLRRLATLKELGDESLQGPVALELAETRKQCIHLHKLFMKQC